MLLAVFGYFFKWCQFPKMIRKPDEETIRSVRSFLLISSLGQATSELILNSIDAKSTNIDVVIDSITLTCEVRDNGIGFDHEAGSGRMKS